MMLWVFRERAVAKDLKESLFSLLLSTFGDLITGITIGFFTGKLNVFPALLILIPPAIGMRGNIFASLGSRLGTYLHTGEIIIGKKNSIFKENINSSFALTFLMSIYIAIIAWLMALHLGMDVTIMDMLLISLLAGIFSALLMIFFTFLIALLSYKRGWNPDNITAPLITLAGDIITLPLLFFSMEVVFLMNGLEKEILLFSIVIITFANLLLSMKQPIAKRILMESIPVFLTCGLLSSFSGSVMGSNFGTLLGSAAILTIVPAFLEDGGAIGGILAARFSSALHTGEMMYERKIPRNALNLFVIMHLIGLVIFPLIGIFGYLIGKSMALAGYSIAKMIVISLLAGEIMVFIVNFLSYYVSVISFRAGVNPDNVAIPVLTSLMDFIGVSCLIGVALLLGSG